MYQNISQEQTNTTDNSTKTHLVPEDESELLDLVSIFNLISFLLIHCFFCKYSIIQNIWCRNRDVRNRFGEKQKKKRKTNKSHGIFKKNSIHIFLSFFLFLIFNKGPKICHKRGSLRQTQQNIREIVQLYEWRKMFSLQSPRTVHREFFVASMFTLLMCFFRCIFICQIRWHLSTKDKFSTKILPLIKMSRSLYTSGMFFFLKGYLIMIYSQSLSVCEGLVLWGLHATPDGKSRLNAKRSKYAKGN